jgi:hypothetical protein
MTFDTSDEIKRKLDELGTTEVTRKYDKLIPIENSEQYARAGDDEMETNYVGHVCYSPDLNCLVYQSIRSINNILQSVDGKGIALSKDIYNTITDKYDVQYVFIGFTVSQDVQIIPISQFKYDWHTDGYDKQIYARLDEGVRDIIEGQLREICSNLPKKADKTMSMIEYKMKSQRVTR